MNSGVHGTRFHNNSVQINYFGKPDFLQSLHPAIFKLIQLIPNSEWQRHSKTMPKIPENRNISNNYIYFE